MPDPKAAHKDAKSPGQKGSKAAPASPPRREYSWEELQGITARAATAIDRVEYLASSQVKFTEFKIKEAQKQGLILRQTSQPILKLRDSVGKSGASASSVFDKQKSTLDEFGTTTKRLEAFNKYVIDMEKKGGKKQMEAAKRSARSTTLPPRPYPLYKDLFELRRLEQKPRMSSSMAVTVPLPYQVPEEALRHGAPKPKHAQTA